LDFAGGRGKAPTAAVTYGLRERLDILAGVKYLREISVRGCVEGVRGRPRHRGDGGVCRRERWIHRFTAIVADGLWRKFDDPRREAIFFRGR